MFLSRYETETFRRTIVPNRCHISHFVGLFLTMAELDVKLLNCGMVDEFVTVHFILCHNDRNLDTCSFPVPGSPTRNRVWLKCLNICSRYGLNFHYIWCLMQYSSDVGLGKLAAIDKEDFEDFVLSLSFFVEQYHPDMQETTAY